MALVKYVAIILFIVICLAKLVSVLRLSEKERGMETNVIKANGAMFFGSIISVVGKSTVEIMEPFEYIQKSHMTYNEKQPHSH